MGIFHSQRAISLRGNVVLAISFLSAALIASVLMFTGYAVHQQQETQNSTRLQTLSVYRTELENAMANTSSFLSDAFTTDSHLRSVVYAKNKTEAYASTVMLSDKCRSMMRTEELLNAFFIYSEKYGYCYQVWSDSFPYNQPNSDHATDYQILKNAIVTSPETVAGSSGWAPVELTDRIDFLYTYTYRSTTFAALIDPAKQQLAQLSNGTGIFYTDLSGGLLYPQAFHNTDSVPLSGSLCAGDGLKYSIISLPLSQAQGHIVFASKSISFLQQFSLQQMVLMAVTLCLLAAIPLCWVVLRRWLLSPLGTLTATLQAIQAGNTNTRVPETSRLSEANQIARTVNTMLDIIRRQKIESYETQLQVQHAQLMYLQVQIRPHFFLNCLNLIYSLAEEKKYLPIQEMVLNLSAYLRNTFKNSSDLIPLRDEVKSANSYIRIQQLGMDLAPEFSVDIAADVAEIPIPPLSLLTFVENSVKYSKLLDVPLEISLKCRRLPSEQGDFLNLTIADNCGGFPPDVLDELNSSSDEIYREKNVGINNVRQRLKLIYGERASITFENKFGGAKVEVFIPIDGGKRNNAGRVKDQ